MPGAGAGRAGQERPCHEGPWIPGQSAGPFPGSSGSPKGADGRRSTRQRLCPGQRCVAVAEAWFLLRSAAGPWAGHCSGCLSLLICQTDTAAVPRPRAAAKRAAGRGPAQHSAGRGEAWGRGSPRGCERRSLPADSCAADCVRKRAEQSWQAAVRMLRKAISRQLFSVQVAGTEYEVALRPAKAPEGQGACGIGQVLQDGKCGESPPQPLSPSFLPRAAQGNDT